MFFSTFKMPKRRPTCNQYGGLHVFEPRYDTKISDRVLKVTVGPDLDLDKLKDRVYVKDICVGCGKTIQRSE